MSKARLGKRERQAIRQSRTDKRNSVIKDNLSRPKSLVEQVFGSPYDVVIETARYGTIRHEREQPKGSYKVRGSSIGRCVRAHVPHSKSVAPKVDASLNQLLAQSVKDHRFGRGKQKERKFNRFSEGVPNESLEPMVQNGKKFVPVGDSSSVPNKHKRNA